MVKITVGGRNTRPGSSEDYHTGAWRTIRPVLDIEKCRGCFMCFDFCPDSAIERIITEGEDEKIKKIRIDYTYCKGCGICANECRFEAISMEEEMK